jgi:hypothetical protein
MSFRIGSYVEQGTTRVEATCDGRGGQPQAEQADFPADWGLVGRGYR